MFTDGLVSLWGDTDNRNHMERHIASDLENYTTATWTHQTDFNGAWSPDSDPVYRIGNQGASTAPGPEFGQVLVTGDEQPELIMLIEKPDAIGDPAVITNLEGSIMDRRTGPRRAGLEIDSATRRASANRPRLYSNCTWMMTDSRLKGPVPPRGHSH